MSQFKKNGTMELETSIGYSFSLIKTEYKQNKIYQNKKKTKRTVNLSFQSALCQQSEISICQRHILIFMCAGHGTNSVGDKPTTGSYRQV